jgi:hypothetical protein
MLFSRKIALFAVTALMASAVGACSSSVTPVAVSLNGETSFADSNLVTRISENVTQSKQDASHFYIDAGNGLKTGASFSVTLKFSNGGGFQTKASADGTASKIYSDMTQLKVALIQSAASPTDLTGVMNIGPSSTTTLTLAKSVGASGGTATVTFTNVPENTTLLTDNYWIAAAALDSGNVNITNSNGVSLGGEKYYVSNGGGGVTLLNTSGLLFYDAGGAAAMTCPAGSLKVGKQVTAGSTNYYVSNKVAPLTIPLQLKEATGATVDSLVTVTNGADRVSTIIGAS